MELLDFYEKRLKDLESNIDRDRELLKQYDDELAFASDPRAMGRYEREIERQRKSIDRYQQEYSELKQKLIDKEPTQVHDVGRQLQQMDDKINVLLSGQIAIYKKQLQILDRYNASEKTIIGSITKELNQTQLVLTENLLQALDNNMVSEAEMQQMLAVLDERLPSLPPSQAAIAEKIIKDPELDAKHKLKITLPIIPLLVEYEGELELGSGFNIKSAWQQLVTKLRRR
ncbi:MULTISPECIES: hypothetical protein [unclassified Tolypothrix]|uniref:hypothetical protein n=1 Tax=unclassified Tolypothrix TaxID=2649714 RepID=UPI0005EAAE93|nr:MULTISPECIES: hypothetical protein [unclassified Tolypothrix]BAY95741.1 hypothetical protein NIES3275_78180 [Microchaete diplosiphon NIES-3275]EKE97265.1 hypothetical protein FDUTEX481_05202 [Tolypothrix sp. PCC 7601]MBE9082285.1 hypothetical protein [Tolypothrix sp. LEGE 11397]UYD30705.1 hypothetical protein HGR01_38380 [Tolypothrix sp. PCC 7712]UYD38641.1 hypothetical protein HG267_39780 [Tolypothrix sp. PCC 7601]